MEPEPVTSKIYYLYKAQIRQEKGGENDGAITWVKGRPTVTICIGKDQDGKFYRGISVASDREPMVTKKDGRNRARGRMIRAVKRGNGVFHDLEGKQYNPVIYPGSAMRQIDATCQIGPNADIPEKYISSAFRQYWAADVLPTRFERMLMEGKKNERA